MRIQEALQAHLNSFGYQLVDTSIIEPARLYLTKAGDQVLDRLFVILRGGQEYILRPEFTASAADRFIQEKHNNTVRWQFSGPIFQDISGDMSGHFQRESIGAELIGLASSYADAEIIALASLGLHTLGVGGYKVVIGHVGLTRHLLKQFNLDTRALRFLLNKKHLLSNPEFGKDALIQALDDYLPKTFSSDQSIDNRTNQSRSSTEQMLNVLLNSTDRGATLGGRTKEDIATRLIEKQELLSNRSRIIEAIDFLTQWVAICNTPDSAFNRIANFVNDQSGQEIVVKWQETIRMIERFGVDSTHMLIKPDLARTWDYYTGIVFEIELTNGVHIGGGGRYDELTRLIGGNQDTPAVGFSYDMDILQNVISHVGDRSRVSIVVEDSESHLNNAIWWAQQLRVNDVSVQIIQNPIEGNAIYIHDDASIKHRNDIFTRNDVEQLLESLRG